MNMQKGKGSIYIIYFITCFVFFMSSDITQAVSQLDQFYDTSGMNSMASDISGTLDKAQTFTVGITGTLDRVDLDIMRWSDSYADLIFDVRTTSSGIPVDNDSMTLASMVVPYSLIPTSRGFFSFDISSFDVSVTSGDVLAIVLRTTSSNFHDYRWFGGTEPFDATYGLGTHYYRNSTSSWTALSGDAGFKTYVTTVVPEPISSILFLTGGTYLAGRRYLKRRNKA